MMKVLLILAATVAVVSGEMKRVCYYTNWSQYRNSPAKFYPENVDPSLCTHLIYAFATLNGNQLKAYEWNDESTPWMKGMFERFHDIKKQNPTIKTLLAVGGWNLASAPFTQMVATDASRRQFATTTVQFLRQNKFDGLDLDWEYPANRGSPPDDKQKFTQLVQTVHNEFVSEAQRTGNERLLLSAAVGAGKEKIDTAYEIPEISRHLDFINLMTYDLHGSWDDHTGHQSPLYPRSGETGNDTYLNLDWAAQYWVQKGAPKEKLIIGMSLYGRTFKLPWGATDSRVGAPAAGAGQAGQYTREGGFVAYYEVCELLKTGGQKYYITEQKVPYMVKGDLWVGYDDSDSLCIKVDYVKRNGFGGAMVWALDLDDFSGICGQGKYPLMKTIRDALNNPTTCANIPNQQPITQAPIQTITQPQQPTVYVQQQTTYVPQPATHAPQPATLAPQPTTQIPPVTTSTSTSRPTPPSANMDSFTNVFNEFDCSSRANGYYPSPTSCTNYYICAMGQAYRTDCHPGLQFNQDTLYCDFADHVKCTSNGIQQTHIPLNPGATWAPAMTTTTAPNTKAIVTTTSAPMQPPTTTPITPPPTTTNPPVIPTTATNPAHTGDFCEHKSDGYYVDPNDCHYFYQCNFGQGTHTLCPPGTVFNQQLTTFSPVSSDTFCQKKPDGYYADPNDCSYFYECNFGLSYHVACASGTVFNDQVLSCDWPFNVHNCP